MTYQLIIDTRERDLIAALTKLDTPFTVQQLHLGDILIQKLDQIVLIIERKTINDLRASIIDGRAREQKARLLANYDARRVMYLIEGSTNKSAAARGFKMSTIIGSLINTQLRDNIHVYKTANITETATYLTKLLDKFEKDGESFFSSNEKGDQSIANYSATLKKQKKANMTPQVWFITALSQIPQITEKIASVVLDVYPSMSDLILAYSRLENEKDRANLLTDLTYPVGDSGAKQRRIGTKISERIYSFIYPDRG